MDALLKGCIVLLLFLITLIAVAPFTRDPKANTESSRPPMSNVLSTTCPLGSVQALLDLKQLSPSSSSGHRDAWRSAWPTSCG